MKGVFYLIVFMVLFALFAGHFFPSDADLNSVAAANAGTTKRRLVDAWYQGQWFEDSRTHIHALAACEVQDSDVEEQKFCKKGSNDEWVKYGDPERDPAPVIAR